MENEYKNVIIRSVLLPNICSQSRNQKFVLKRIASQCRCAFCVHETTIIIYYLQVVSAFSAHFFSLETLLLSCGLDI